jgi:hypothetical protein
MRPQYLIFCLTWIGLSACKQPAGKTMGEIAKKDTLAYAYQTVKKRAFNCGDRPDSGCTTAKIKYPVFTKLPALLNDSVMKKLLRMATFGNPGKNYTTVDQAVQDLVSSYEADFKAGRNTLPETLDISVTVLRQDSSLTVLKFNGYGYWGGAHGGSKTLFLNWNAKTDKEISVDDIFNKDYSNALNNVAEKIFRKDEKLSDTASLKEHYFFEKSKFSLNDNFAITPTGLSFLYNEYEIKSYAEGQTTLFIPYAQIKSLLRPGTVISQYLK